MKILPGVSVSRVVVPGDAPWPLRASHGRRWDFPHFAVNLQGRRRSAWLIFPFGARRYMARHTR